MVSLVSKLTMLKHSQSFMYIRSHQYIMETEEKYSPYIFNIVPLLYFDLLV